MWEQKADVFQPTCSSRFRKTQADRSEFLDHLLVVLQTKCHKDWFINILCSSSVKVQGGENEEVQGTEAFCCGARATQNCDMLQSGETILRCPFKNGPWHIYSCHRNDELTPTRLDVPQTLWSFSESCTLILNHHWSCGRPLTQLETANVVVEDFVCLLTFGVQSKKRGKNTLGNMWPGLAQFMPGLHNTHFLIL